MQGSGRVFQSSHMLSLLDKQNSPFDKCSAGLFVQSPERNNCKVSRKLFLKYLVSSGDFFWGGGADGKMSGCSRSSTNLTLKRPSNTKERWTKMCVCKIRG